MLGIGKILILAYLFIFLKFILQNEYKRGISGWNFNLDDMKAQASLVNVHLDLHFYSYDSSKF